MAASATDAAGVQTWIDRTFPVGHETNVHAAPSADSPAVAKLRRGVEVLVVGVVPGNAWLQVKLPDGTTVGYVPTDAVPAATGASPSSDGKTAAADAPAGAKATIVGHPIVRDTATLVIGQRDVHLFGLEGEGGEMADGLQLFISANGGAVTCQPLAAERYVCLLPNNVDVAMVSLLNGAARMTADAPDAYRDEQLKAQAAKKGIWGTD